MLINVLKKHIESYAKGNILRLRVGGLLITLIVISISGTCGWIIERFYFAESPAIKLLGLISLIFSLASAIAYRSLYISVLEILNSLQNICSPKDLDLARNKLQQIVGRETNNLDRSEILRAAAESTSENSVDGVFAPMFWMIIGLLLWNFSTNLPGPLSLAWVFKASSTLDSMLGYKEGNLTWLGYTGAKLDDLLTWIPCRIVFITLPLISKKWSSIPKVLKEAWIDGSKDESPNSGLSEAIFAHCFQIKMGGANKYNNKIVRKEILAKGSPEASENSIKNMLKSIIYLQLLWIVLSALIINSITI